MGKKLLKLQEVARILGLGEQQVYRYAREGILPVIHIGRQLRVDPEALDTWIANGGQAYPGGWKKEA